MQKMRTQPVAARTVAEALLNLALEPAWTDGPIREVAGPLEESLVEIATLWATRRGLPVRIQGITNPADLDGTPTSRDSLDAGTGCESISQMSSPPPTRTQRTISCPRPMGIWTDERLGRGRLSLNPRGVA